jgi:hypothetical protein
MKRHTNRFSISIGRVVLSLLLLIPVTIFSQNNQIAFSASFVMPSITLNEGEIISNVLKVVSNGDAESKFSVSITVPGRWNILSIKNKIYSISPKDTLYIPIRIIPSHLKGNAQYFINAIIRDEMGKQRAGASFVTTTTKQVSWEMNLSPSNRIYFMNNETSVPFSLNVLNRGNENQDIVVTMSEAGKNGIVSDSAGLILKKRYFNFNLDPIKDTTVKLNFSYYEGKRNFRRIDLETYNPGKKFEEKKYSLYFRSQDPKLNGGSSFSRNKRIEFVRLNSIKKVSQYNSFVIPVIMEANAYNIMSGQPVMNLIFRGNTLLENGANLVYFTQMNYSSYQFNPYSFQSNSYYLGYFHRKGNVQIGDVGSNSGIGIPASGRGITGEYHITDKQSVGGYFTMAPRLINPYRISYGLTYRGIFSNKSILSASLGRTQDRMTGINSNFLGARYVFGITRFHHFGVTATGSQSDYTFNPGIATRYGCLLGFNYGGILLNEKLTPVLQVDYSSRNFSNSNSRRFSIADRVSYQLPKRRALMLQNNYMSYEIPIFMYSSILPTNYFVNQYFNNALYYSTNTIKGRIMPGIFYNFTDQNGVRNQYRGVSLDYNTFNPEKNSRFSFSTRAGYNHLTDYPSIPDFFSLSAYSLFQYHTIQASVRYNYGYQNIYDVRTLTTSVYPQLLYLSVQDQYVFPDPRFVLETAVNYSYQNYNYGHNFGLFPDLYFYSFTGWRFKLSVGYNFNRSMPSRSDLYSGNNAIANEQQSTAAIVNQGVYLGFGVRKEFGLPIPKKFRKKTNATIDFVAFIDLNGNRIMDPDEIPLENIVIRVGDHEMLTDVKGEARLVNIPGGTYTLVISSLTDLQGWFPLNDDSIQTANKTVYLPFIRGVKIFGEILMEREKVNEDIPLDLSRIKITAVDSLGKLYAAVSDKRGSYVIYLPLGRYSITMDERVLGDSFFLTQNNYDVTLKQGVENVYTPFYIVEKKRKVIIKKFGAGGQEDKKDDH